MAAPAQVTCLLAFTLQLRGPFTTLVWAGSQQLLLSVPSALCLLVLVKVFQRLIGCNYRRNPAAVKGYALVQLKCYRNAIVRSNENVTEVAMAEKDPMTVRQRRKYIYKIWGRNRDS